MNTTKLKKFAQDARQKLLEQIAAKLEYVLTADTAELREMAVQVSALKDALSKTGKALLIEKVAYTWFNRLVALRFMDANSYQPLDLRVVSPKVGHSFPELLDEAKEGHVPEELKVNTQRVFDLLDRRVPGSNPQNEAYRVLLIGACNHLHLVFPFLFERINDYTELLLPDDLTSEFSVVHDVREGMTTDDCQQVEIIGWLYQFYISEKKDEVFASKAKVKTADIPAATQLFTPRWIVEYMVQNTVGKLWLQNRPNSLLREHMPYFIESASHQNEDYLKINSPEEITFLDPACGSGHILVYAFELLSRIYEEEGYSTSEIPNLIIKHNLYGFEIDERASQLAAMALMMKARGYQRRFLKKGEVQQPHILCFQDLKLDVMRATSILSGISIKSSNDLLLDLDNMRHVTNFGSLIMPCTKEDEIVTVLQKIEVHLVNADVFEQYDLLQLKRTFEQLALLGQKFSCIVANPPYMGNGGMNDELGAWAKVNYPDSKADLFAMFIERGIDLAQKKGYAALVTMQNWMFLNSFEALRKNILAQHSIKDLIQIGYNSFPELNSKVVQACAFVINKIPSKSNGSYLNLNDAPQSADKKQVFLDKKAKNHIFITNQKDFEKIPGCPFGYWLRQKTLNQLLNSKSLSHFGQATKGLDTCDNNRFVRFWYEVEGKKLANDKTSSKKWYTYHKGGDLQKWFGNHDKVVNWEYDGAEIRNFRNPDGSIKSRPQNIAKYFQPGITWSSIGSGTTSYRVMSDSIFGGGGNGFFPSKKYINFFLGFLNSKASKYFLDLFNPTLNNPSGDLNKLPIGNFLDSSEIEASVSECTLLTHKYLSTKENSPTFEFFFLPTKSQGSLIENLIKEQISIWKSDFDKIHTCETVINTNFIDMYGLHEELSPDVPMEEITILQEETSIKNGKLVFHLGEIMTQFISYAVGCMFGRFSLDKSGLILANQGETLKDYLQKVERSELDVRFLPDADNILPVLDGEWFEDDIASRFREYLKATFGMTNFAKNLAFVEECLGKDLRKYFVKDFYNDHVQRYKKRPIYWLFSSPQGSFNALVYLHRYTPDTVNNLLNKYLREYQEKLRTRREHLVRVEVDGTGAEKAKAAKEKEALDKVLLELQDYERNILYPLATERIALNLDHGVLVNYNKFGKAVKLVPGLNDAKAQKQVCEFDWVETETTA